MVYLLELRERAKKIYQDYKVYCMSAYKFLMALITFLVISSTFNYNEITSSILTVLFVSVICTFLPMSANVFMAALYTSVCLFYFSPVIAVLVVISFIVIYYLFLRFTPRIGYAFIAIPVLFVFKMPVLAPIVLGLTSSPAAVIPVVCGTIVYYLFKAIKSVESVSSSIDSEEAQQVFEYVINEFVQNKALIFTLIVFSVITILVYVIKTREIMHSREVAIVVAGVVNMIAFLIGNLYLDTGLGILAILFGTIFSCIIAYLIIFFRYILDYTAIEKLQFEDDDYYYYVKAVPKVKMSMERNDIKKITFEHPGVNGNLDFGSGEFGDDLFGGNKEKETPGRDTMTFDGEFDIGDLTAKLENFQINEEMSLQNEHNKSKGASVVGKRTHGRTSDRRKNRKKNNYLNEINDKIKNIKNSKFISKKENINQAEEEDDESGYSSLTEDLKLVEELLENSNKDNTDNVDINTDEINE